MRLPANYYPPLSPKEATCCAGGYWSPFQSVFTLNIEQFAQPTPAFADCTGVRKWAPGHSSSLSGSDWYAAMPANTAGPLLAAVQSAASPPPVTVTSGLSTATPVCVLVLLLLKPLCYGPIASVGY